MGSTVKLYTINVNLGLLFVVKWKGWYVPGLQAHIIMMTGAIIGYVWLSSFCEMQLMRIVNILWEIHSFVLVVMCGLGRKDGDRATHALSRMTRPSHTPACTNTTFVTLGSHHGILARRGPLHVSFSKHLSIGSVLLANWTQGPRTVGLPTWTRVQLRQSWVAINGGNGHLSLR